MAGVEGSDVLEIEIVIGEDFAAQIFWTSEYGDPIPVSDPVLMDVKDANGQIAMRFNSVLDAEDSPRIDITGYIGFFQLTAPRSVTSTLIPGKYRFDLFAAVAEPAQPFPFQVQQVVSGYVIATPRVTILEGAAEVFYNSDDPVGP